MHYAPIYTLSWGCPRLFVLTPRLPDRLPPPLPSPVAAATTTTAPLLPPRALIKPEPSPPPPPSLPEMRIDASDGTAYDKQSFIDVYGGTKEWDAAKTAPSDPKAQAATERGQYPIRLFPMHLARFWNGLQISYIYIPSVYISVRDDDPSDHHVGDNDVAPEVGAQLRPEEDDAQEHGSDDSELQAISLLHASGG